MPDIFLRKKFFSDSIFLFTRLFSARNKVPPEFYYTRIFFTLRNVFLPEVFPAITFVCQTFPHTIFFDRYFYQNFFARILFAKKMLPDFFCHTFCFARQHQRSEIHKVEFTVEALTGQEVRSLAEQFTRHIATFFSSHILSRYIKSLNRNVIIYYFKLF